MAGNSQIGLLYDGQPMTADERVIHEICKMAQKMTIHTRRPDLVSQALFSAVIAVAAISNIDLKETSKSIHKVADSFAADVAKLRLANLEPANTQGRPI